MPLGCKGLHKAYPASNPRELLSARFLMLDPWMQDPGPRRDWSLLLAQSLSKGCQPHSLLSTLIQLCWLSQGSRELILGGEPPQLTESQAGNCLCEGGAGSICRQEIGSSDKLG